jgi:hypothetical protein
MRDGHRDDGIEGQPIAAFSVLAEIRCPVRMMTSGVAAVLGTNVPITLHCGVFEAAHSWCRCERT